MRFVDDDEKVLREIIEKAGRPLTLRSSGQMTRVVFDAGTGADLEHHLDVEVGARFETLGFEQLVRRAEIRQTLHQLFANEADSALDGRTRSDEVLRRIDRRLLEIGDGVPSQRIDFTNPLDLVAPHLDSHSLLFVRRENLHRITAHPERPALEAHVVTRVLDFHQRSENVVARDLLAFGQSYHLLAIAARIAQTVNRRDGGYDNYVAALHQTRRRAEPQTIDVFIDRGVLLDVGIRRRDVGFRLVIVVVRDEVLDRIRGEETLELPIELCR